MLETSNDSNSSKTRVVIEEIVMIVRLVKLAKL